MFGDNTVIAMMRVTGTATFIADVVRRRISGKPESVTASVTFSMHAPVRQNNATR